MLEIEFVIKEKSLSELEHYKQHYQQVYPHANQKGKSVLRHHLKKLNVQIQCQQDEISANG